MRDKLYLLASYDGDILFDVEQIELTNYDGDPYGDSVPFPVGSNQSIISWEDATREEKILSDPTLNTKMGCPEATTAAKASLHAAIQVLNDVPDTGGCVAFYTQEDWKRYEQPWYSTTVMESPPALVIVHDGGEFAPLCNPSYEASEMRGLYRDKLDKLGYQLVNRGYYTWVFKKEK